MSILRHSLRVAAIGLGLAVGAAVAAPMYKWVDEQGNVQYTQSPPADREAQTMKAPPPSPVAPEEARKRLEGYQQSFTPPDPQQKANDAEEEAVARDDAKNCEAAKRNRELYANPSNRRFRQPDGSAFIPTDAERKAKIDQADKAIQTFCREGASAAPANKAQPGGAR